MPTGIKEVLKSWQLDGLRFMWNLVIVEHESWATKAAQGTASLQKGLNEAPKPVNDRDEDLSTPPGGVILAHTMGAGKTLQVWSSES